MKNLITILAIHASGHEYQIEYPSREACSTAMVIAEAVMDDPEDWAQCIATYAPSVSMRPMARGEVQ